MANAFAPSFGTVLADPGASGGPVDLNTDTIKVALMDAAYVFSTAHDFYDDVSANVVGTPQTIANPTVAAGGLFDGDDVTFTAVPSGDTVEGYWIYKDTGNPATSRLIAFYDTKADASAISIPTNGGNITIQFNGSGICKIIA